MTPTSAVGRCDSFVAFQCIFPLLPTAQSPARSAERCTRFIPHPKRNDLQPVFNGVRDSFRTAPPIPKNYSPPQIGCKLDNRDVFAGILICQRERELTNLRHRFSGMTGR
jgi:hypothetical protein